MEQTVNSSGGEYEELDGTNVPLMGTPNTNKASQTEAMTQVEENKQVSS